MLDRFWFPQKATFLNIRNKQNGFGSDKKGICNPSKFPIFGNSEIRISKGIRLSSLCGMIINRLFSISFSIGLSNQEYKI